MCGCPIPSQGVNGYELRVLVAYIFMRDTNKDGMVRPDELLQVRHGMVHPGEILRMRRMA